MMCFYLWRLFCIFTDRVDPAEILHFVMYISSGSLLFVKLFSTKRIHFIFVNGSENV